MGDNTPVNDSVRSSTKRQHWDAHAYGRHAAFVSALGADVLRLLGPSPGERVLDLGCGDGTLAAQLLRCGCTVVGVDASPSMVRSAKAKGVDARIVDGQTLQFQNEFDAVFTNAALHWMPDTSAVMSGVWRSLKAGGRFVGEMGGQGNVATIVHALRKRLGPEQFERVNPWVFPAHEDFEDLLCAHGFRVDQVGLLPRQTLLPGDVRGWLETFAQPFLQGVPGLDQQQLMASLEGDLRPVMCDLGGHWWADYVRLRFHATKVS